MASAISLGYGSVPVLALMIMLMILYVGAEFSRCCNASGSVLVDTAALKKTKRNTMRTEKCRNGVSARSRFATLFRC